MNLMAKVGSNGAGETRQESHGTLQITVRSHSIAVSAPESIGPSLPAPRATTGYSPHGRRGETQGSSRASPAGWKHSPASR